MKALLLPILCGALMSLGAHFLADYLQADRGTAVFIGWVGGGLCTLVIELIFDWRAGRE